MAGTNFLQFSDLIWPFMRDMVGLKKLNVTLGNSMVTLKALSPFVETISRDYFVSFAWSSDTQHKEAIYSLV